MDKARLIEQAVQLNRGVLSPDGALIVRTGKSTGRSTKERFVIRRPEVENDIEWSAVNQPMAPELGDQFFDKLKTHVKSQKVYTVTAFVGCFRVTVHSVSPWHVAFAQNMFREDLVKTLKSQISDDIHIEIWHDPEITTSQLGVEHTYGKAIVLDPLNLRVGICGTAYAGEIKKSAFTLCNFLMPKYGILSMHSSANCTQEGGNSSLLFGLSGTGKTTLSADPKRYLIGDDEIVWSANGLSNLEGGCYAKLINLSSENEPDIYKAANRFGSILENVGFCEKTRSIDFDDNQLTENTRASYSINALGKVFEQKAEANAPQSIIFLTADAFGALPTVARLDHWQAQYHFISGYTAKVAGTEIDVIEPEATFSACFGAPFMPRPASVYGQLLAQLAKENGASIWVLNTGWIKGYGKSDRFPIPVSRQLLTAIQSGDLNHVEMKKHPIFGFEVPTRVPGLDPEWLNIPEGEAVYNLAKKFIANAESKPNAFTKDVIEKGGPIILN